MKQIKQKHVELCHDGNYGYYYNFDSKLIEMKTFNTSNFQKQNIENIKNNSGISLCLILILIPVNNWYRSIASFHLNIIIAILFIIIAMVINYKIKKMLSQQKEKINNISFEQIEIDKEKIDDIILSSENIMKKSVIILTISSIASFFLIVTYFKYSILIFFPAAVLLILLFKLLVENVDFYGRKLALKEIKKNINNNHSFGSKYE